jgi:hypothetical protein
MPCRHAWLAAALLLLITVPASAQTAAPDPAADFAKTIAASRLVLTISDGRASGTAAAFLAGKAAASHFFLVGEEHGVATIADTIRALVPLLQAAGYQHFAVETDPYMTRIIEDRLRDGGVPALAEYMHREGNAISMPFFNWSAEAALAEAFLSGTARSPQGGLWGLDQVFIGAYGPLLARIAAQTSDPAARELAGSLATQAKGNLDFLGKVDPVELDRLRAQLERAGDAALLPLLDDMILSRRIYAPFVGQSGWSAYQANRAREDLMKRNFLANYRAAGEPKALFKFGSNHMARGLSPTHVPSLGNFVAEMALSQAQDAFNLLVLCGPGTQAGDFLGNTASCEIDLAKAAPEVAASLDATHPTLFDLASWKDRPSQWRHLPDDLRSLLWAYDAVLVVPNGRPARLL